MKKAIILASALALASCQTTNDPLTGQPQRNNTAGGAAVGAAVGALVVWLIASGRADYDVATNGLGQNGWGAGYGDGYTPVAAFVFETVATFLFVLVILGATHASAPVGFAGLAIGLTLAGIHLVGISVTGVSVNPARSFGPALFAGGQALSQLWLFFLAPALGAVLAGLLYRAELTRADARP